MTQVDLSHNKIGDDEVNSLSIALMNENNKVTSLNLSSNHNIGADGAKSLSTAFMNGNNKVTTLILEQNSIGIQGSVAMLKSLRFSVLTHLEISKLSRFSYDVHRVLKNFCAFYQRYFPRLVCLASVRTISRIGLQSTHFRMLSRDLLIRIAQTLGWFIDLKGTLRLLEEHALNE